MDPKETAEKEELVGARAAEELNLTLILSSVLGFCVVFYVLVAHARRLLGTSGFCTGSARRVLLVTAHPDDETMFFGPTVVRLVRQVSSINERLKKAKDRELVAFFKFPGNWAFFPEQGGDAAVSELGRPSQEGLREEGGAVQGLQGAGDQGGKRHRTQVSREAPSRLKLKSSPPI